MSHPGIIIQTVTSEDLSDPLGQSELVGEQELEKEEPSENHNNSGEEEQSEERSKDVQEEEKVSFSESITKMKVFSCHLPAHEILLSLFRLSTLLKLKKL